MVKKKHTQKTLNLINNVYFEKVFILEYYKYSLFLTVITGLLIKVTHFRYIFIFTNETRKNLRIKETIIILVKQKKVIMCSGLGVKKIWKGLIFPKGIVWGRKENNSTKI